MYKLILAAAAATAVLSLSAGSALAQDLEAGKG
jgi:hypothetical protein